MTEEVFGNIILVDLMPRTWFFGVVGRPNSSLDETMKYRDDVGRPRKRRGDWHGRSEDSAERTLAHDVGQPGMASSPQLKALGIGKTLIRPRQLSSASSPLPIWHSLTEHPQHVHDNSPREHILANSAPIGHTPNQSSQHPTYESAPSYPHLSESPPRRRRIPAIQQYGKDDSGGDGSDVEKPPPAKKKRSSHEHVSDGRFACHFFQRSPEALSGYSCAQSYPSIKRVK
jgi:hypothetical protein